MRKNTGYILLWLLLWQSMIMGIVMLCWGESIEQQRMNRLFHRQLSEPTFIEKSDTAGTEEVDKNVLM